MANKLTEAFNKESNKTTTTNGMKMKKSSLNSVVDLFFSVGASRGKDIIPLFQKAVAEDLDLAVRVALYARDVREGIGERQLFRDMMKDLAQKDFQSAQKVLKLVPVLGRWDDLFCFVDTPVEVDAIKMYASALEYGDGLAAKWAPRLGSAKHHWAIKLRNAIFGKDPGNGSINKKYRKLLSSLSKTVEQQMSANQWDEIDYNHVPSVASARYQKAFGRHDEERYGEYISSLEKDDGSVKINASAVYPYDILRSNREGNKRVAEQQWKALPDWIPEGRSFLPMIDVSGSMSVKVSGTISAMDVAVSLGLYCAQRAKGSFKDNFLTFSSSPEIHDVSGLDFSQSLSKIYRSKWGMSTNIEAAYKKVLEIAVKNNVPQEDMPECLIIFSDMQFNSAVNGANSIQKNIKQSFKQAGYEVPKMVYWNLYDYQGKSTPVTCNKDGVVLVSGFSPSLMKNVLTLDIENFTPINMVKDTVMVDRYDWM